jgi:AraC-like DNA-binding protein
MLHLQSAAPSAVLRPFVRAYAERTVGGTDEMQSVCMPRVETILKFELGTPLEILTPTNESLTSPANVVVGAFGGSSLRERLRPGVTSFVIFFLPSGFTQLFGVPMVFSTNAAHEGEMVVGRELRLLRERLGEAGSFADRVVLVETMLFHRLSRAKAVPAMMHAADRMLQARGTCRIEQVAGAYGFTTRHFERQFVRHTGFSPKHYARVARFQWAIDLKLASPERSWTAIAHELRYHDQMHLVHDFRKIAGAPPTEVIASLGDSRPQAPAQRNPPGRAARMSDLY